MNAWGMGRLSSRALVMVASFALAAAVACGTSNGDATDPGLDEPPPEDDTTSTPPTPRPSFEAGFDPDGGTPDGSVDAGPDAGTCSDPNDPGGAEASARVLPPTDDGDNSLKPVNGVIMSAVDVDVYKLTATDKTGSFTDTEFSSATPDLELCVFVRCKVTTQNAVTGCVEGNKTNDPVSGWEGCCAGTPGNPTPEYDCSGVPDDDSADFIIRVSPTATTKACQAYTFQYRF